jgi:peroxiredoxin
MNYNYQRYRMSNYDLSQFRGPKAGEEAIDFTVRRLDGREVRLSDYRGKWVVLETGSLTCPMYVKNINPIARLRDKYPEVEFLVIYVREAHPGSRTRPAASLDEKIKLAKEMRDAYGEQREILVDDLEGPMHQSYGSLPNMVYVVDPEGQVIYRCDWSFANRIDAVLADRERLHTQEHVQIMGAAPWITVPVTLKGGWDALWDLAVAMPFIFWAHIKVDIANLRTRKSG